MKEQDKTVALILNGIIRKGAEQVNKEPVSFEIESKVWYMTERQPGSDKLQPVWKGPVRLTQRVGYLSYVIELRRGIMQQADRSQLNLHIEDTYSGEPVPMYFHSEKASELEVKPDE